MNSDETITQQSTGKSREELDRGLAAFRKSVEKALVEWKVFNAALDKVAAKNFVMQEPAESEIAQLRADLAREREQFRADQILIGELKQRRQELIAEKANAEHQAQSEKAHADALEKELAERGQNDRLAAERFVALENAAWKLQDERDDLKSRLATMQKHADALAETLDHAWTLVVMAQTEDLPKHHPDRERTRDQLAELFPYTHGPINAALAAYRAFTAEKPKAK